MPSILDDEDDEVQGAAKRQLVEEIGALIERHLPGDKSDGDVMGDRVLVAHLALGYQIADVYEGHGRELGASMLRHVMESMPDVMDEVLTVHAAN